MLTLSDDQKRAFIRDGFLILRDAVPPHLIADTLAHTDAAAAGHSAPAASLESHDTGAPPRHPDSLHRLKSHRTVTSLFFDTGLCAVAEQLLSPGKTALRQNYAQIAYNAPRPADAFSDDDRQGPPHPAHNWHIDASHGRYAAIGADFMLLVGVALSEGQDVDENRGQFTVYPGSHVKTHPTLRDIILSCVREPLLHPFPFFPPLAKLSQARSPRHSSLSPDDLTVTLLFETTLSCSRTTSSLFSKTPGYPAHTRAHPLIRTASNVRLPVSHCPQPPASEVMQRFRNNPPDVGEPVRALLRPGDAIVAHQRLAHVAGTNMHSETRKNVYFRVEHADFAHIVEAYVTSPTPWVGFAGLADLLTPGETDVDYSDDRYDCTGGAHGDDDDDGGDDNEDGDGDSAAAEGHDVKDMLRKMLALQGVASSMPHHKQARLRLTDEQKRAFMHDGVLVVRNVAGARHVERALGKVRTALANEKFSEHPRRRYVGSTRGVVSLKKHALTSLMLTNLLTKTGAVDVAEGVLGAGNVVLLNSTADVSIVPQSELLVHGEQEGAMGLDGVGWGKLDLGRVRYKGRGADHFVKVGFAVTDGLDVDENRGQLVIWPGSSLLRVCRFSCVVAMCISQCCTDCVCAPVSFCRLLRRPSQDAPGHG